MKILVGLSNGLRNEQEPYQMLIVDVDNLEEGRPEWQQVKPEILNSCANIRVNLGSYQSILQNPVEYLEAEFDVSKLIDVSINNREYQIINIYEDEGGNTVLYQTANASGEIEMHHISEFPYKKKFSIYGENMEELPSYVKPSTLSEAYDWWSKKDKVNIKNKKTRFAYENFDTTEDMPVQLLYHYLIGVKGFELGYHTITDITEKEKQEKLHEYFLFNGSANIKLKESMPVNEDEIEVSFYGNKDPYPDKQKLGYYGATMSLICDCRNYPAFDVYTRPTSEISYDKEGIEVTVDIIDGCMGVYNRYEEAGCIAPDWRIGEHKNIFGVTLANLLPDKLANLSKQLESEKERIVYGHWSSYNTNDWFQVMGLALSSQYYTPELRNKLSEILREYQTIFASKLTELISRISAKDTLEVMKWAEDHIENVMEDISFIREGGNVQKSNVTMEQMKNLFTFKRNNLELPDWLQIYSADTIEKLGGVAYLKQFIRTRGEESAESYLSIWAEKLESDQRYAAREHKDDLFPGLENVQERTIEEIPTINPEIMGDQEAV